MSGTVVKVGGSLGRGGGLRALCVRIGELGRRHALLLVPGGGVFADVVREQDGHLDLGDDAAHWMAVAAMEQSGHVLARLIPGATTVDDEARARQALSRPGVAVLLPYRWLTGSDPLPHEWEVTSDSIAAWVARVCGATRLVLLKPSAALAVPLPSGARAGGPTAAEDLAGWPPVDRRFHEVAAGLKVVVVDGQDPEGLEAALDVEDPARVNLPPRP